MTENYRCYRRDKAIRDIESHAQYIAESSVRSALKFVDCVQSTVTFIQEFPMAGGKFVTDVKMLDNIRGKRVHEFPRFVIFYQIKANAVEIVRVLGWGQDVDALLVEAESG